MSPITLPTRKTLGHWIGTFVAIVTIFFLGLTSGAAIKTTRLISSSPDHVWQGYDVLPDGQYEVLTAVPMGGISYLTLMDSDLNVFLKRLPTEAIVCKNSNGFTLMVGTVSGNRILSIEKTDKTVIGTSGPSYAQWLNQVTQSPEKLADDEAAAKEAKMASVGMTMMGREEILSLPPLPEDSDDSDKLIPLEVEDEDKETKEKAISKK